MKISELGINTPTRLRDLIRNVRTARTAAEERSIAQKESASIRNYFRNEDNLWRSRNVAKLLYLYLLGYPAHFGQLECLRLISSKSFTDKRIGYLGATLLLDEQQSTHLLITNSLKKDLKSENYYVIGIALTTMASISSEQMCRDCLPEIESLISSTNSNIRKKAILCTVKMIERIPEFSNIFLPKIKSFLVDKHHGIMNRLFLFKLIGTIIAGTTLLETCVNANKINPTDIANLLPVVIRTLKTLIMSGYNPDYDVSGIADPFLQVRLIRSIMHICKIDFESRNENDLEILAQLSASTDTTKNVSNAILYEAVLTLIKLLDNNDYMKTLIVNILGLFLSSSDKNVRYVALETLLKIVKHNRDIVHTHQALISECLSDFDDCIKRRAMQLTFAITDKFNVKSVVNDMIKFLGSCEGEFKADCASDIFECLKYFFSIFSFLNRFSSDPKWKIDVAIEILVKTGNLIGDGIVPRVISLISSCSNEYHIYSCIHLYDAVKTDKCSQALSQIALWCFGEYYDKIIPNQLEESDRKSDFLNAWKIETATENDFVETICDILDRQSSVETKLYALNCLIKIAVKSKDDIVLKKGLFANMPEFVFGMNIQKFDDNQDEEIQNDEMNGDILIDLDSSNTNKFEQNLTPQKVNDSRYTVIDDDGLLIQLWIESQKSNKFEIIAAAFNQTDCEFCDFLLQVAVTKSSELTILPPDGKSIIPNSESSINQKMIIKTPTIEQKPHVRLRAYVTRKRTESDSGQRTMHQCDFCFP